MPPEHPQRQWDYPFGWPPHQMSAWQGLVNYGYRDVAARLATREGFGWMNDSCQIGLALLAPAERRRLEARFESER